MSGNIIKTLKIFQANFLNIVFIRVSIPETEWNFSPLASLSSPLFVFTLAWIDDFRKGYIDISQSRPPPPSFCQIFRWNFSYHRCTLGAHRRSIKCDHWIFLRSVDTVMKPSKFFVLILVFPRYFSPCLPGNRRRKWIMIDDSSPRSISGSKFSEAPEGLSVAPLLPDCAEISSRLPT